MSRMTSRMMALGLTVAAATAAACVLPTDACGCTPVPPPYAWLEGTVITGTGAPVVGASVHVYATRDSAPPTVNYLYGRGALTNSRGEYRTELGGPGTQPVYVHATIIRGASDTVRVRGGTVVLPEYKEPRPTFRMSFQLP